MYLSASTSTLVLGSCLRGKHLHKPTLLSSLPSSLINLKDSGFCCLMSCYHLQILYYSRYLDKLGRHNYVTPTSYLELISSLKTLLGKKQDEVCFVLAFVLAGEVNSQKLFRNYSVVGDLFYSMQYAVSVTDHYFGSCLLPSFKVSSKIWLLTYVINPCDDCKQIPKTKFI